MDAIIGRKTYMPLDIEGATILDRNGDYNIYINDRISFDRQCVAFRHEIEHIKQGHFYSYEDLLALEKQAAYG